MIRAAVLVALVACGGERAAGDDLFAEATAAIDDPAKLDAVLARAPDDATHDILLHRLAVDHPDKAGALCPRMRTADGRAKCASVLGRPHLGGR